MPGEVLDLWLTAVSIGFFVVAQLPVRNALIACGMDKGRGVFPWLFHLPYLPFHRLEENGEVLLQICPPTAFDLSETGATIANELHIAVLIRPMLETFFWLLVALVFYVYAAYPILLKILSYRPKNFRMDNNYSPFVTLFIPVYNEEAVIEEKLRNSLALDYPPEKLEVMVISDGSTDRTNSILTDFSHPNVTTAIQHYRSGKNACINQYVPTSRGEILVFSDANSMYRRDAIRKLVRHFHDTRVGCVCGNLKYVDKLTSVGKGEGLYFRYEAFLKDMESKQGAVVSANGAIYAFRKTLFEPIPLNAPNDFVHPIEARQKGYFALYDREAIAEEKASITFHEEFERRTRIVTRSYTAYKLYSKQHRILRSPHGLYFLSHKLLRWHLPLLLLPIFVLNILLMNDASYACLLIVQIAFYLAGFVGYAYHKAGRHLSILYVPFYFCLINLAAMIGIIRYYTRGADVIWEQAPGTRINL